MECWNNGIEIKKKNWNGGVSESKKGTEDIAFPSVFQYSIIPS
jgi:hypothetical protein